MSEFVVKIDMEEMPKSCDDCDIAIKYQRFGTEIYCPYFGWYADRDKCPIICQLPEGHGRLVDADAVESIIRKWFEEIKLNPDILLDGVKSLPTIVPAERSET